MRLIVLAVFAALVPAIAAAENLAPGNYSGTSAVKVTIGDTSLNVSATGKVRLSNGWTIELVESGGSTINAIYTEPRPIIRINDAKYDADKYIGKYIRINAVRIYVPYENMITLVDDDDAKIDVGTVSDGKEIRRFSEQCKTARSMCFGYIEARVEMGRLGKPELRDLSFFPYRQD